ncbi:hypothetical protein ACKUT9_13975 [Mycobacterium seoulense]|uniref:hypothetical protein n=1 Tax=Mycobacterium seoulense TaxID=386911 RepID=UPI003CF17DF0
MTDARVPDRWLSDRRLQRLSDSHFRAFITSLVWSVSNRTNGQIEPEDLGLIPSFAAGSANALVAGGLWAPQEEGWLISDFRTTQTSSEQLAAAEAARIREREKKAKQRAAKRAAARADAVVPKDIPGDVLGDNTGQDRQGQDRPREVQTQSSVLNGDSSWRGAGLDPFEEYR